MSRLVEKSIGGFLNSLVGGSSVQCNTGSTFQSLQNTVNQDSVSFGLINFVERLEAAKKISKQEEEELVSKEYQEWVRQASHQNTGSGIIADYLCRSLIAFSRGHYFTNLHVNAIKLTQCDKLFNKKIGYLYISRTMAPGSDLSVLLVNTVQKDLASNHIIEIASGLNLFPTIITADIAPLISNGLSVCLSKQQDYIRRRAVIMAATVVSQSADSSTTCVSVLVPDLLRLLSDCDPAVAIASTMTLAQIYKVTQDSDIKNEIRERLAVASSNIILQAVGGSLSPHYSTGPTHAPYVQIQMLRVIQILSSNNWDVPEIVTTAVNSVLTQPWGGRDLTLYMTFLEGISTAVCIQKEGSLIAISLKIILGFLKSSYIDFKYLGIKYLTLIFGSVEETLTESHLEAVLECLYSSSQLLQSRTVRLLCSMANKSNYQAICTTLMDLSHRSPNPTNRRSIMNHLANILKRLSVDLPWCISFLSPLLIAKDTEKEFFDALTLATSNALKRANSVDGRNHLVATCNKLFRLLLDVDTLTCQQVTTFASVLNIIFVMNRDDLQSDVIERFLDKINSEPRTIANDELIECLLNCGLYVPNCNNKVLPILEELSSGMDLYSSLKIKETISLLNNNETTKRVLEKKSKIMNGEYKPDLTLSFFDSYVIDSCGKANCTVYEPVVIVTEMPHKLTTTFTDIKERTTGFKNPFDTHCSSPTYISIDKDTLSTSGSVKSSFGVVTTSLSPRAVNNSSVKPIWTSKGRHRSYSESGDTGIEIGSEDGNNPKMCSSSNAGNSCIEIAHEANESLTEEPMGDAVLSGSLSFIESQKADLTKVLLKGLGLSKE